MPLPYLVLMKIDSARGVDQGDLTRLLGRIDAPSVEAIVTIVERHYGKGLIADDVRQYAEIGRWEYDSGRDRSLETKGRGKRSGYIMARRFSSTSRISAVVAVSPSPGRYVR
jgi:hypothetical protein